MDILKIANTDKNSSKKVVVLKKEDLPLTIEYKDRRYVLILTKNDRLILQKAID